MLGLGFWILGFKLQGLDGISLEIVVLPGTKPCKKSSWPVLPGNCAC